MHDCQKEKNWGELGEKVKRYDKHLEESDKDGGYRQRLVNLERSVRLIGWGSFICAFVGSLVGQAIPFIGIALKAFFKSIGVII